MSGFFSFFGKSKRAATAAATADNPVPAPASLGPTGKYKDSEEDDKCPVHFNELQYLEEGGHKDIVRNLICMDTADGRKRYLISSSDDSKICIWDVQSGQLVHALLGHTRPVTCMLVLDNRPSPSRHARGTEPGDVHAAKHGIHNSLLLISGSSDKTIKVWDILRGVLLQDLKEHSGSVKSLLAVDCGCGCYPDSQHACCGGTPQNLLLTPQKFRISPSVYCARRFCSGANDKYICLWDVTESGVVLSGKITQYEDESK